MVIVAPIVCGGFVLGPNVLICSTLCPKYNISIAIISLGKRKLVALLLLSS